jgi:hypothetical protein
MNRRASAGRRGWRRSASIAANAIIVAQTGAVTGAGARSVVPGRVGAQDATCPLMPIATSRATLRLPGDSGTYVDRSDVTDHSVSVGAWVGGRRGVVTSRAVRDALQALIGRLMVVPLRDAARGQGTNAAHHVCGSAGFSVTEFQLPKDNRIGARHRSVLVAATS